MFLASYQHCDRPAEIAVGDRVSWPLAMRDGIAAGWPDLLLAHANVRLAAFPAIPHGSTARMFVATSGRLRARWAGSGITNRELTLRVLLDVDYLTPPFVRSTGVVTALALLTQVLETDSSGRLIPGWKDWSTRPVQAVPSAFEGRWDRVGSRAETGVIAMVGIAD